MHVLNPLTPVAGFALHVLASPSPDSDRVEESVSGFDSGELLMAGIIFVAGVVFAIVAKVIVHRILRSQNEIIARLAGRVVGAIVFTIALIYALSQLGIRVGLLLGALGVGGFALAFAMQDILSNLVAGVILQLRQPFSYDDYVSIDDYEGTVTDINLRAVEMKLFSGEAVIIPSSTVLQNPIENWTRLPKRRIDVAVGVGYDADIEHAASVLLDAVTGLEGSIDDPGPQVIFDEFGGSSVNLTVRLWFPSDGDYFATRLRAATAIKQALEREEIDIPFPIRTLLGPGGGAAIQVPTNGHHDPAGADAAPEAAPDDEDEGERTPAHRPAAVGQGGDPDQDVEHAMDDVAEGGDDAGD